MFLSKQFLKRRWVVLALSRLGPVISPRCATLEVVDDSDHLGIAPPFLIKWPVATARPRVGLVRDVDADPYWTKYRRFLVDNSFPCRIVDIHSSSWIAELKDLDVVVWCPGSQLCEYEEERKKIFYMERFLGLVTVPSSRAMALYEDKVLQSWVLGTIGVDVPKTVASFSKADAAKEIAAMGSEIVWKIAAGSGSAGVERLTARQARAAVDRAFSWRGRKTYWPYANQKGYAYAQALERDLSVDMRIEVVGSLLFGYYRDAPSGEFRASGMNLVRYGELPPDALEEAWRISRDLDVGAVAVDFITDAGLRRHKVIEFSSYIKMESPEQLIVDGVPGAYVREGEGRFRFIQGRYWVQELQLAEALARASGLDAMQLLTDSIGQAG